MSEFQEIFAVNIPIAGTLTVSTGVLQYPVPVNCQLVDARATASGVPTGTGATTLLVKKNGVAVAGTTAGTTTAANGVLTFPLNSPLTPAVETPAIVVTPGLTNGTNYIGVVAPASVPVATSVPGDYYSVDVTALASGAALAAPVLAGAVAAGGNLTAGTYLYKITAVNANGETVGSNEVSVTTATTNLTAALTWAAITGAATYNIYRTAAGGATNTEVKVLSGVTATSYNDTGLANGAGAVPGANTTGSVGANAVVSLTFIHR